MGSVQNDVLRIDVIGDFDETSRLLGVYQLKQTNATALSDDDLLDDLRAFFDALYTVIKGLSTALTVWKRIRINNITTNTFIGETDFGAPLVGTASGDSGPPGNAAVLNFPTGARRVITRKYLGPLSESNIDSDGRLATGALTALATIGALLVVPIVETNGSYAYGYLSPKTGQFEEPGSAFFDDRVGYQRRRKQGVGV